MKYLKNILFIVLNNIFLSVNQFFFLRYFLSNALSNSLYSIEQKYYN